jgi:alpha-1,6-mannosyltransferase
VKLLDVTEFYSATGGGVRTYLAEKCRWLATGSDWEHVVVVPASRDAQTRWAASRVHLLRGPPVPASPGYHFLLAGRKLAELVRRERPDVIEVGSPYLAPWLARRAARQTGVQARVVTFVHEDPRLYARRLPWLLRAPLDALLAAYLRAAHANVDLAVAAGAESFSGLGVKDTAVVSLGVDTDVFHPRRRDAQWRVEVGATSGQPVLLYAGRLSAEKGLGVPLDALDEIHQATGARLVLIGEGHLRPKLERAARARPDALRVLPFERDRARLARAYASADLCFAPCPYETFGLAALEAMASGLPVVGVAAGGIGRLLDGAEREWGRTYRVGDAYDCARATRELLATDVAAAGRGARAAALRHYRWDRTFTELFGLYRRLVLQPAGASRTNSNTPSAAPSISV